MLRKFFSSEDQAAVTNFASELRPIDDLVTRIDARLSKPGGRVIGLIASGSGEGTSSVALAYASAVCSRLRRRVLLLGVADENLTVPGVLSTLATGASLDTCLQQQANGIFTGYLNSRDAGDSQWEFLNRSDLWQDLRSRYDEIVVDLPASSSSGLGLVGAVSCDGVVIVLEAEKTRAPVAENLIASLQAVHAPILGTVLNKRRYYLPQRVYRWL